MKKNLVFGTTTAVMLMASLPSVALATSGDGEEVPAVSQASGEDVSDSPLSFSKLATVYGPSPVVREISEHNASDDKEGDGESRQETELPDGATVAVATLTLGLATGGVLLATRGTGVNPVADTEAMPRVGANGGEPADAEEPELDDTIRIPEE